MIVKGFVMIGISWCWCWLGFYNNLRETDTWIFNMLIGRIHTYMLWCSFKWWVYMAPLHIECTYITSYLLIVSSTCAINITRHPRSNTLVSNEAGSNMDLAWSVICQSACCASLKMCRPFLNIDISLFSPHTIRQHMS